MRADNNWEDKVGKRLFDVEGEPAPQAWENISRRIAPKSKPNFFWKWLPVLLLFISLPLAFYKSGILKKNPVSENPMVAGKTENQKTNQLENTSAGTNKTGTLSQAKTSLNSDQISNPGKNQQEDNSGNKATENGMVNSSSNQMAATKPGRSATNLNSGMVAIVNEKPEDKETKNAETKTKIIKGLLIPGTKNQKPVISSKKENSTPEAKANQDLVTVAKTAAVALNSKTKPALNAEKVIANKAPESGSTEATKTQNQPVAPEVETSKQVVLKETEREQVFAENKVEETSEIKTNLAAKADSVLAKNLLPADTVKVAVERKEKSTAKNWQWAIYGAPQYTFQRVFANVNDEVMILRMTNKNEIESERLGYEFGFRGLYPLKENIQLEMGFHFARLNQHIKFRTANTIADSVTVLNQNGQVSVEIRNREQNEVILFQYFFGGLYAGANLNLSNSWTIAGGFGANYLLWKNPDEQKIPIPTNNVSPYLSAGLKYNLPLSANLTLQAGPMVQYFVRPVQKESAHYGVKPTTFGFNVGLLFSGKE